MKYILVLSAIFLATVFSSCKKNYTCQCTETWTQATITFDLGETTKKDAGAQCDAKNQPEVDGPYNCHLQ